MAKSYVALARVSSREQEREGFSLDVQEDAVRRYAERQGGTVTKLFRIAETASKQDERQTFKALMAYAKEHVAEISGVLFYKVDRAARNIFDYVELERFEADTGIPVIYVAQPTENSPAGRMQRRILSNMASFYTEQQSLDVREGMARRVQSGLFIGHAPYGYRNIRIDGRGMIEKHPDEAPRVRRVFELYAFHNHTLDSLIKALEAENIPFSDSAPRFSRTKLHRMLRDRSYIGEIKHQGQWFPGTQESLIDRATWDRVQVLLGEKIYRSHEMTYAGELITCGHCGHPITGESKLKKTKTGAREYVYYRCSHYTDPGHPRTRLSEAEVDQQVLALFARMRIEDNNIRSWVARVIRESTRATQENDKNRREDLQRQVSLLVTQQDRLLNLRLVDEIDATTFSSKNTEINDRIASLRLKLEACDRGRAEHIDLAVKAFELSQSLSEKWVCADYTAKRRILEIISLNCRLDNTNLVFTIRKPFDVLADGLILKNGRGGGI